LPAHRADRSERQIFRYHDLLGRSSRRLPQSALLSERRPLYRTRFADPSFRRAPELPSLFITHAFAQVSGASPLGSSDMLIQFAPFVVIFAIMYFLILRPQQQRAKAAREMVQSARRGDVVVTSGGLIGKITKATDENEVDLEIAPNVRVRLARSGITDVRSKGEPVKDVPASKGPPPKKDAASS
jgi:preprotein translocase subunit YajC